MCLVSRSCLIGAATAGQLVKAWDQFPAEKVIENGSAPKGEEMLRGHQEKGDPKAKVITKSRPVPGKEYH